MRQLTPFNQWDERWRNVPLGKSGVTLGSHGCYTTAMACGLKNWMVKDTDPKKLAEWLNRNDGYTPDGQLEWNAIPKLFPGTMLYGRAWTTNVPNSKNLAGVLTPEKAIADIRAANAKGQVVGICVDRVADNGVSPDHIVLAVETWEDLDRWKIMDPDGGYIMNFRERYGSPLKGIMGYRTLIGSPANFPEDSGQVEQKAGIAIGFAIDNRYSKKDMLDQLLSG